MDNGRSEFTGNMIPQNPNENTWDYSPEHDNKAIGNKIISTPESSPELAPEKFGEILPTSPIVPATEETVVAAPAFNDNAIKTTGDHLDALAIDEVDRLIDSVDSNNGELAGLNDSLRHMTAVNLDNSFNRKLGK